MFALRSSVCLAWLCLGPVLSVCAQAPVDRAAYALQHPGDAGRGRHLYAEDARMICTRCHNTNGQDGKAGPDLSGIGDKFTRQELIRAVLQPSAELAIGYQTTVVNTRDDEQYSGVLKQVTADWLELTTGNGKLVRIPLRDITEQHTDPVSLMPAGLTDALTPDEFSDLIAYLQTLQRTEHGGVASPRQPALIPEARQAATLRPFFRDDLVFDHPVWFGAMPGMAHRFAVLEVAGKLWSVEQGTTADTRTLLLDVSGDVHVGGGSGMLGLAFDPAFNTNHRYYLVYQTQRDGRLFTRVMAHQLSADGRREDPAGEHEIMRLPAVTQDHTGGALLFGPDGYLYIGMGDTGPQRDPQGHAQDLTTWAGKILRINVQTNSPGRNYAIPVDNPFLGHTNALPEIWAYGLREPWRAAFDFTTGDLWVGDVGQDTYEEITMPRRGENHGWNVFEGITPYSDRYRRPGEDYVPPVFSYSHHVGVSVTGGLVYRGQQAPELYGRYLCGDFESRKIWALTQTNRTLRSIVEIGRAPSRLVSFGVDQAGEPCVVGFDSGIIYQLDLRQVDPAPCQARVLAPTAETQPVFWRYVFEKPTNDWQSVTYDDSHWAEGPAGFGTIGTPGAVVRTDWHTADIWLRREITLPQKPSANVKVRLHHDENVDIYLNGVLVVREPRWTGEYVEIPLRSAAAGAWVVGRNVLAVHCHQISGGQYVDAGLVEYVSSP
ncbi:MAG TPA: PQQ-dependent sugar dehydrogenase [Verrucomicrobiae bacterium]